MRSWIITRRWLRNLVKRWFWLYDISDLEVGAHCGICGAWMPLTIAVKGWDWNICNNCGFGKHREYKEEVMSDGDVH